MRPSNKKSIISLFNWLGKNRIHAKNLQSKIDELSAEISDIASKNIELMDDIKKHMGNHESINIKINDRYYTLTKCETGIGIRELVIHE